LGLANYSEFGLIVAAVGVGAGWMDQQWLVIIALALTFSFVISSILNARAHSLYAKVEHLLHPFESSQRLAGDISPDLDGAEVLVVGMGRVGSGAYLSMQEAMGDRVCGIDADSDNVTWHQEAGHKVILGDAEDRDFWRDVDIAKLRLIMLAMPTVADMYLSVELLKEAGYCGIIAAVTKHDDDRATLEEAGVHATFNFYAEAGAGFAEHVQRELKQSGQCVMD
jgi:NADPH:quinone reductase-like Zn-dependent oxidoreductase